MYILFDNLTATLLTGTVVLILLAMQMRIADMNAEQTATYMSKKYSLNFADWLQDDLLKLGRNMDADEDAFDAIMSDGDDRTMQFTFYRDSLRTTSTPTDTFRVAVRYVLGDENGNQGQEVRMRTIDTPSGEQDVPLYRLTRKQKVWNIENAEPGWSNTNTGMSSGLLEHFQIQMLDGDGGVVTNPAANDDQVRQMRAQFALVPPFGGDDGILRAMHWSANLLLRY